MRNGGRRTEFSNAQFFSFFERARSPTAAQRRNSVTKRQVFLKALEKTRLELMETPVGNSRGTSRAKAVTVYPMDLFPTDA